MPYMSIVTNKKFGAHRYKVILLASSLVPRR